MKISKKEMALLRSVLLQRGVTSVTLVQPASSSSSSMPILRPFQDAYQMGLDTKPPGVSDSLRFQSTAQMMMASHTPTGENLGERTRKLRARKLANTKTSICFGFGPGAEEYESTANPRGQEVVLAAGLRAAKDIGFDPKTLKKQLTQTSWSYGYEDGPVNYEPIGRMVDTKGQMKACRGVLDEKVGKMIKSSSLYFGSDGPSYSTTSADALTRKDQGIDYKGDAIRAAALKSELTRHSFEFTTDEAIIKPSKEMSTYAREYLYDPIAARSAPGAQAEEVKADLRKCHFQLGYDSTKRYQSDEQGRQAFMMNAIDPNNPDNKIDLEGDRLNSIALKKSLQKTSIVLGDDEKYMH